MAEERKKTDFVFELLKKECNRRIEEIWKTQKIEPQDVLTLSVLKINGEVDELAGTTESMKKAMVTKKDLWRAVGIGLTVATLVISVVTHYT